LQESIYLELGNLQLEENVLKIKFEDDNEFKKLGKLIEEYFSNQQLNSSNEQIESETDKNTSTMIKICILYNTLKEMRNVTTYELEYFAYFEKWHDKLLLKSLSYRNWCNKQKEYPLDEILENSKNV
jgi:hypothetical protein